MWYESKIKIKDPFIFLATYWNQVLECDHFSYRFLQKKVWWLETTKITFIFTFVIFNFANKPSTYTTHLHDDMGTTNCTGTYCKLHTIQHGHHLHLWVCSFSADLVTHLHFFNKFTWLTLAWPSNPEFRFLRGKVRILTEWPSFSPESQSCSPESPMLLAAKIAVSRCKP